MRAFSFCEKMNYEALGPQKNLLLTGRPGIGKTTLILKITQSLGDVGGFYTHELREGGRRVGFSIKTFAGKEGILSHQTLKSPYRVGRYRVNLEDIDRIGVESVRSGLSDPAVRYLVIDEIARMELYSENFKSVVLSALDSTKPVLATIQMRTDPFLDAIKSRPDVRLIDVNRENRDSLPDQISNMLLRT